jgi:23S rRNA (cytosine1962-C5)-methyltransferase
MKTLLLPEILQPTLKLITPKNWQQYELIDCGNFEKLERFGDYILARPEPQAIWDRQLPKAEWDNILHARFAQTSSHKGDWKKARKINDNWQLAYEYKKHKLRFKLALTAFKHVGIFPEQAENWDFIIDSISSFRTKQPKVLNLFAYTGGASLAAKAAGADVVHVDSVKQVVGWARENMELSRLNNIRWTVEDAAKFVKREVKRGRKYNGIILDPPAYGIGASGERWKLEDSINDLLRDVSQLLDTKENFLVLNTYSLGFSALIIENLINSHFSSFKNREVGELYLNAKSGVKLPLGVFARLHS